MRCNEVKKDRHRQTGREIQLCKEQLEPGCTAVRTDTVQKDMLEQEDETLMKTESLALAGQRETTRHE